jgi:demethylmenaquinone methyltransferase/2-methoxy-6-polyprenyl-1,4-benzoquinol methylase
VRTLVADIRKEVRSMNVPTELQTRSQRDMSARSYDRVSSIYERLAVLFTGGQNLATRISQLEDMHPGQRVLYVGVGPGEEALEAASRGIKVTCVDLSPSMVETVRKRFESAGLPGEFVCADIMEYQPAQPFDVVVANFFLNVFSRPVMEKIMARLVSLVRPGGDFVVADFGAPRGNVFLRARHRLYYYLVIISHRLMGLCAFHPIYIYTDYYPKLGLTVQSTRHFRLFILGPGPWIFQTTRAVKDAAVPQAPQPSNRSAELHEAALHVGDA